MSTEIEVLVKVESNLDMLKDYFAKLAKFKHKKHIKDYYFYDPLRNNLKPDNYGCLHESLRIRNSGSVFSLTNKIDHFYDNGKWNYSDEFEIEVSDFDNSMAILKNLGFRQLTEVDVVKTYYELENYEIAIEEVLKLGNFLEVEYKGVVSNNHVDIKSKIELFISNLPCVTSRDFDGGKPELMIRKYGMDEIYQI